MNHLMLPLLSGADYKSLLLPNGCRMSCLWCLSPPLYCFTLLSPPVLFVWSVTSFTSFCSLCLIAMASLLVWAIWQTGHGADNTLPCVCIFKCISYRDSRVKMTHPMFEIAVCPTLLMISFLNQISVMCLIDWNYIQSHAWLALHHL